jgi:RHS repeat-associated protein
VSDWRGDVRLVLNTTETGSAAVVQEIDYDAWGNVTNFVDPGCTVGGTALCWQPFGFAGGLWEPATGIVRFGARDYDPMMARWAQKDPIGFGGGQENIYVYANSDPVNGGDPNGEGYQLCLFGCGAAYVVCLAGGGGDKVCTTILSSCIWACGQNYPPEPPNACSGPTIPQGCSCPAD